MPFITQKKRELIEENGGLLDVQPGDLCYVHYKKMVDQWKANPRWTTAHDIYDDILHHCEYKDWKDHTAILLAWQVFFIKYVMPYEDLKEKENGTI